MFYNRKYEDINGYFDGSDMNMTEAQFDETITGLIAKGLVEVHHVDGEIKYRLTPLGILYGEHSQSNPKTRN